MRAAAGLAPVFHGFHGPYYFGYIPVRFIRKAKALTKKFPLPLRKARQADRSIKTTLCANQQKDR